MSDPYILEVHTHSNLHGIIRDLRFRVTRESESLVNSTLLHIDYEIPLNRVEELSAACLKQGVFLRNLPGAKLRRFEIMTNGRYLTTVAVRLLDSQIPEYVRSLADDIVGNSDVSIAIDKVQAFTRRIVHEVVDTFFPITAPSPFPAQDQFGTDYTQYSVINVHVDNEEIATTCRNYFEGGYGQCDEVRTWRGVSKFSSGYFGFCGTYFKLRLNDKARNKIGVCGIHSLLPVHLNHHVTFSVSG